MSEIILYDLPSRDPCRCWSLNPWKARSLLNFKNIPYRTQWVEYPDIAPLFESLNVTPNPSGAPTPYSSPAITLPDGKTHIMDSLNIARYLDEHYPDPPAYVSDPMTERIFNAVTDLFTSIRPILIPRVPEILNQKSKDYFIETREKRMGSSLSEIERTKGGEAAWKAAEPHLKNLSAILHENSGPYTLGQKPSYADLILVSFLQFCVCLGRGKNDVYDHIVAADGKFGEIYSACRQWFERDSY